MKDKPSKDDFKNIGYVLLAFLAIGLIISLPIWLTTLFDAQEIHEKNYGEIQEWCEKYPEIIHDVNSAMNDNKITHDEYYDIKTKIREVKRDRKKASLMNKI